MQAKNPDCLGSDINWRTGNKVSHCIELSQEDFNQLVWFKSGKASSFIIDLVKTLINFQPAPEVTDNSSISHKIEFLFDIGTNSYMDEKGNYRKLECVLPSDEKVRSRALEALKDEKLNKDVYDNF